MIYEVIDLEQRTEDWKNFRLGSIGSSDAAIIMGVSKWKSEYQLWLEKCQIQKPSDYISTAMQRGIDLEDTALASFIYNSGIEMIPKVVKSLEYDFMGASLDGLSKCGNYIVELKCPGNEAHVLALSGKVPDYYYPQLQHQLAVTGLPFAYYFSFDGECGVTIEVPRDEEYIKELISKEEKFWYCVQNFVAPEGILKDYHYIEDETCEQLALKLISLKEQIKEIEKEESQIHKELVSRLSQNSVIGKVKATKIVRQGNVDYSLIPQLKEVNLNQYRKKPSEYWKIEAM